MIGQMQLLGCCTPVTTPVYGPAFPGAGTFTLHCEGTANLSVPVSYDIKSMSTPCYSYDAILKYGPGGYSCNVSVSGTQTSAAMTSSDMGNYSLGVRWKKYALASTSFSMKTQIKEGIPTAEFVDAAVDTTLLAYNCDNPPPGDTLITEVYDSDTESIGAFAPEFGWLGVAQRELPGIRLKRISGAGVWLVRVDGGVVTVYRDDGSASYSTYGTLKQVADNINASSIGTFIQARCSGWNVYFTLGETNGDVAASYNEWHYLFTKNDPSTMLKDLGPTYINVYCNDTYAPFGWGTSTRLPVYVRGEILPPRGVVYGDWDMNVPPGFNTASATNPEWGVYDNDEDGALEFVTEPLYLLPGTTRWCGNVTNPFGELLVEIGGPTGSGIGFDQYWNTTPNATRVNNGPTVQNAVLPLSYGTSTVQLQNIQVLGTCTLPCPFTNACGTTAPFCQPDADCFLTLYCVPSGCFYRGICGDSPTYSCSTDTGCLAYYEQVVPGDVLSVTPPTSVTFQATTYAWVKIT